MGQTLDKFRHIVITGASSGIGAALAAAYARPGVVLSLQGRHEVRLGAVAALCVERGAIVEVVLADVTDRAEMARWLTARDAVQPVDLVIANAGVSAGTGPIRGPEDPEQVRHVFDVNVMGVLNTIEPLLPVMQARGKGHIALMSSLAGFRGFPGAPAYCGSKAAVRVYGEGLRGSLRGSGVGVSVICPGFVRSPMTDANGFPMPFLMPAERAARIIQSGIARGRGRIAFPFATYFLAWTLGFLPDGLAQVLLRKVPAKSALL